MSARGGPVDPGELLRAVAETGSLAEARARFPGLGAEDARRLLVEAANALGPRADRVQIACDGAARGNPGPAGAGAVLQSADGQILARLGRFLGKTTNNVAEYEALLLGLRHARRLGAKEVRVVSDSELLVKQLSGEYQVRAPGLKPLHAQAKALLREFSGAEVVHVPRAQNAAADQMANRAIDEGLDD